MRRLAFITLAALSGAAAFGQSLLDCVEPDVLRALLLQGQGERQPVITAAVPPEIAALRMPAGFTWIGSAERIVGRVDATTNRSQVTAAWRSTLAPDAARAATATALGASGWQVRAREGSGLAVFNSGSDQVWQTACRDGKPVNMSTAAMDGVTYVMFTIQRGNNSNSICNSPERPMSAVTTEFEKYLPRLDMPTDPATGATVRMQGGGGIASQATMVSMRAEFTVKDSVSNVARQFAEQMAAQGWSSDTSWIGSATAGSSWSRRSDAGVLIQSTLVVTAVDERQFVAALRVLRLQ